MTEAGNPTLTAWLDTEGDGDQLHVRVEHDGTEYEAVDLDLAMLLSNEQYVQALSRASLTLLTLYEREVSQQAALDADEVESEELEAD